MILALNDLFLVTQETASRTQTTRCSEFITNSPNVLKVNLTR